MKDLYCALKDITRAIHLRPDSPEPYIIRGQYLYEMKRYDLASFCIHHTAEMTHGSSPVQQALVQSFLQQNSSAIDCLVSAIKDKPVPPLIILLGKIQMKAKKNKKKMLTFSESFRQALDLLNQVDERSPTSDQAEVFYLLGLCYMEQFKFLQAYLCRAVFYGFRKRYSKAIMNCNSAIKVQPHSVRAYLYRGALKYYIKAYKLAIRDLTKATELDPSCSLVYYNRGVCYHQIKMYEEALKDYSIVVLLGGWKEVDAKVLVNRGLLYLELQDYANALEDFKAVAIKTPGDVKIHQVIGNYHHRYVQLNLLSSDHYRKYAVEVPSFLKNRPRAFISHVMKRYYSSIDSSHVKCKDCTKGFFEVKSELEEEYFYAVCVGMEGPSCTCTDWKKFLLPCKHMSAVFRVANWKWDDINPAYSRNPLFSLDSDCFMHTSKRQDDQGFKEECRLQGIVATDQAAQTIQELPPRRRRRLTILIRHCINGLKRLIDSVYLLDKEDFVELLIGKVTNLSIEVREQIPQDGGLVLQYRPQIVIPKAMRELPERTYGKPKQSDLRRVGYKADMEKVDVWETVTEGEEESTPKSPPPDLDDVWLTINNIKLTFKDRERIANDEWLDDNIINVCQYLIKKKNPAVSGLMDTLILAHSDMQCVTGNHILQIHHVGAHWLVSMYSDNSVTVFDSMHFSSFSDTLKRQLIKLYRPHFQGDNQTLDVKFICCQKQKGPNDCGLFSIANTVALAEGIDLKRIQFVQSDMRRHLLSCLEQGRLEIFPHETKLSRRLFQKTVNLTTYCLCHIFKPDERMVECSLCKSWFHFTCVNLNKDDKLLSRKRFYCPLCTEKK